MPRVATILLVLVVTACAVAQGDGATLKSGAIQQGRVAAIDREGATMRDGERVFRVRWEEVRDLRSSEPVTVVLDGGDRLTLNVGGVSNGQIEGTHATLGAIRIPLARLAPPEPPAAPVPEAPPAAPATPDAACCVNTPLAPKPFKGKIALSGTVRSGNVDSVLAALHAEGAKDCAEDRISAAIDALYGKTDDELTAASLGGKARWDHFYNKTFYSYANAELLYDDIQNLDLRAIAGIGAGDFLWKCNDDQSWSVEGGISALYEDFSTQDDPEFSPAARVATTYKEIIFTDLKLEEQLELLVPLNDVGRYLARSRTVLGVPLCQDLALRLSLEITYQGDPPPDTTALDILGLVGVEYQF